MAQYLGRSHYEKPLYVGPLPPPWQELQRGLTVVHGGFVRQHGNESACVMRCETLEPYYPYYMEGDWTACGVSLPQAVASIAACSVFSLPTLTMILA
jgi:hypothetical protein